MCVHQSKASSSAGKKTKCLTVTICWFHAFCNRKWLEVLVLNEIIISLFKRQADFLSSICFLCFNPSRLCQCTFRPFIFPFHSCLSPPAPCNTSNATLPSHTLPLFPVLLASHSRLLFSQRHRSFSLHLPPTPFMLQIGASGCHDVKRVAQRLAGMASFLWWHNVAAMSYALKQWFDVTAVSASLSNAGGGCHIPAGNALSDKLMSAAQPPHRHKNFLASHTFMKVFSGLTKLYYIHV